jgi:hypothetical protein
LTCDFAGVFAKNNLLGSCPVVFSDLIFLNAGRGPEFTDFTLEILDVKTGAEGK